MLLQNLVAAIAWSVILRLVLRLLWIIFTRSRHCSRRLRHRHPGKNSSCWLNLVRVPRPLKSLKQQREVELRLNAALWGKLPSEVLQENILPRLPLLAVAKFRVVCRQWNRILTSPELVNHAAFRDQQSYRYWVSLESSQDAAENERSIFLWFLDNLQCLLMHKVLKYHSPVFFVHSQPLDRLQPARDCLVASSGGLLAMFDQARIIVCNPLLGTHYCFYRSRRMYRMFYGVLWCEHQQNYVVVECFPTMLRGRVYHGRSASIRDFRIPDFACQVVGQGTECNGRLFWPSGAATVVSCSPWLPEVTWKQLDGPPQVFNIRCLFSWDRKQLYVLPQCDDGDPARECWKMVEDDGSTVWEQVEVVDYPEDDAELEPVFMDTKMRSRSPGAAVSEHTDFLAFDKLRGFFVWMSVCKHEASRIKQRWSLTNFHPSLTCQFSIFNS